MRGENAGLPRGAGTGTQAVDARLVTFIRCLLALSALALVAPDSILLAAYCIYCVALWLGTLAGRQLVPGRAHHWIDLAVYIVLAVLAPAHGEIFFALFLFAILAASFTRGFAEGMAVAALSAASLGVLSPAAGPALAVLILGLLMACWGGREREEHRRLELLRDIAALVNPRLGVDFALSRSLRRLREFFAAEACILVCARGPARAYALHRVDRTEANGVRTPQALTKEAARALLELKPGQSLVWRSRKPRRKTAGDDSLERLANLLETDRFATVPFRQHESSNGRLYLVGSRRCAGSVQLEFLRQVAAQVAAAVDSLTLMDQVMQNASQLERARISRDIHDTTLQPYIGLKLGLEALARRLEPGSPVAGQVGELLAMSSQVIADLRGYVARLRGDDNGWPGEHLLSGLREHVGRYRSFYGIDVDLRTDLGVRVTDRVAGEAYQIVCEALSNIHRHTPSKRAYVELRCQDEHLAIEVGNESSPAPVSEFLPRSIAERAAALGGRAEVQLQRHGHDVVRVAIPL